MKKVSKTLATVLLCAFITLNSPVIAQTPDTARTTVMDRNDDDDDDDMGNWGLVGLLGLLGLLGLRRKTDDVIVRTPNVNR